MSTGVSIPPLRRSRQTSKPLRSGSITSRTTRSKGSLEAPRSPVSPSAACSTRWPSLARRPLSASRRPGSSSTSRIRLRTLLLHCGRPLRFRGGRGQHEREGAPRPRGALDLDRSPVRVHDALHEVETEAAAGHARGQGLPPPIEGLEYPALFAARNPRAAIAHGNAHDVRPARPPRLRGDPDPPPGGGVAGGGLFEVVQGAAPGGPSAPHRPPAPPALHPAPPARGPAGPRAGPAP